MNISFSSVALLSSALKRAMRDRDQTTRPTVVLSCNNNNIHARCASVNRDS